VFIDKVSGKLARRPRWDACLDYMRPGDQLVVTRLSRVARSVQHLTEVVAELERRDVDLVVLKQGLDPSSPAGQLLFHLMGAIADLISEGTPRSWRHGRHCGLCLRISRESGSCSDSDSQAVSRRAEHCTVAAGLGVSRWVGEVG
jgi:DNA invertase Pin-like site-specific DNA recombinase